MNKIKKLSIAFLVIAMAALLSVTAFAATSFDGTHFDGVTYGITSDANTHCVSEEAIIATVTVTAQKSIGIFSLDAYVELPTDWKVVDFTNESINVGFEDFDANTGRILWNNKTNVETQLIAQFKVQIPAGAPAGEYRVGLKNVQLSNIEGSGDNWTVSVDKEESIITTITLKEHSYALDTTKGNGGYEWIGTTSCTAYGKCICGATTSATVNAGSKEKTPATCLAKGTTTYTANFSATSWATTQSIDVDDIAQKEHSYTGNGLKDLGDGTHLHMCINGCNLYGGDPEPHAWTEASGTECDCGAVKPAEPVGLKGDVDRNGVVDQNDVIALLRHVLKAEIITDEVTLDLSEVTGDTSLDQNDVIKILRYVLKAIDSLD